MAFTEYSSSSEPLAATLSMALKVASTGPLPLDSARHSVPPADSVSFA
jgi:hypothetical protein